ncbi:MAG: VWA domain-containing protein [Rhizobiaceae bacterium]|nr:VWA domain-containing protein [Rhizobiaceae bacterium]
MKIRKLRNLLSNFKTKINGNVAVIFGIAIIPIMMTMGTALDYSRYANLQTKVASATDAALLAATAEVMSSVDVDDEIAVLAKLNSEFEPFFLANMDPDLSYDYNGSTLSYDIDTKTASVNVDIDYNTSIVGITGIDKLKADIVAATSLEMKAGGAVSMYLVLDRSGSMGWSNGEGGIKMDTLKSSVAQMISNLSTADPDRKYIRMGAVAYSSYTWKKKGLRWKLSKINDYVQDMRASGGTDSSGAINRAYRDLKKQREINKHAEKNGQVPNLVIIFMTDGDNNDSDDDYETLYTCTLAKNYGMTVYTVAYNAPSNGQALLGSCASSNNHYFEANNATDLEAAFSYIGANVAKGLVLSQ